MEKYELVLTPQAENNLDDTINTLVRAAQEIAAAAEKDFEKIKCKKWYNRLWELVTFNNDNQKIQARGVGSLAKLNEIVIKSIVLISKQSKDTANLVTETLRELLYLKEDLTDFGEQQWRLIEEIQKIKRGFETEKRFDELSENQRDIIFAVVRKYALGRSNEDTSALLASIRKKSHNLCGEPNFAVVEGLPQDAQKILYNILVLHSALLGADTLDETHELFRFISLSENSKAAIRNRVKEDIELFGKSECIEMFEDPEEEYVPFIDGFDFEWYDDYSEEDIETGSEKETVRITKLLQIPAGEEKFFIDEDVYVEANIDCHGTLKFMGCNVYYNCGENIGKITLSPDSELVFYASEVTCCGSDETAFIQGKDASICCANSVFNHCSNFISASYTHFYMTKCGVYNCLRDFVCINSKWTSSVEDSLIKIDDPDAVSVEVAYRESHRNYSYSIFNIDHQCEYKNNLFFCPIEYNDSLWLHIFNGEQHSLENCTFITLGSQSIHCSWYPKTVNNCLFVGGSNVISLNGGLRGNSNLSNSMFIGCKNAVDCYEDVINKCTFVDCLGTAIEAKYRGGAIVEGCLFMNTKAIPKVPENKWSNEIGPCVKVYCSQEFMEKGKNKPNQINGCTFYNLNNYDYIVAPAAVGKPEETIAVVENCRFANCDCKQAIQTDVHYYTDILEIKKTVCDVLKAKNCEGVDIYGWGRGTGKTISHHEVDVNLTETSFGCEYLTSAFYYKHDLVSAEMIQSWIQSFEENVIAESE